MALTDDQITAQNFKEFYGQIRPYLNGAAHSGFTPVGVVISVMGKTAPLNYLVCDGTVYNIADYPELAAYFARQFDICNYFGGDGETTFAVPDLRGEFLRGMGTNSHSGQGSGANVGVHQDGTAMPQMTVSSGGQFALTFSSGALLVTNTDAKQNKYNKYAISSSGSTTATDSDWDLYTSRPTNTSVLYCIAYKNIFVDEGCNYSTDERVVGTWINGKPIYQKTVKPNMPATIVDGTVSTIITPFSDLGIINPEIGWVIDGIVINKDVGAISTINYAWQNEGVNSLYFLSIQFHMHFGGLYIAVNRENEINDNVDVYVTVRYTKTTD